MNCEFCESPDSFDVLPAARLTVTHAEVWGMPKDKVDERLMHADKHPATGHIRRSL